MNKNEINKRISDRTECFYWQTDRKISAEEAAIIWKDRHSAITNEELLDKINLQLKEDKILYISSNLIISSSLSSVISSTGGKLAIP